MTATRSPSRPAYADRQFLQAADLRLDQDYHRQMRWRHNLALHSWGVVGGLAVYDPEDGAEEVRVGPGMALDGFGRELVLPQIGVARVRLDEGQAYDVWLEYAAVPSADGRRTEERPRVSVTRTIDRPSPDPAGAPPGLPAGDRDFTPDRPPPADDRRWPVLLGRLDFRTDADGGKWAVDVRERRYAGLVADRVVAPARDPDDPQSAALLLAGTEPDRNDFRFAVSVAGLGDLEKHPPFLAVRQPRGGEAAIDLRAQRVTVAGDLHLRDGAAVAFDANPINADPHGARLSGSGHWRMYHHFATATDKDGKPVAGFDDELRITLPAAPAGGGRVVVGAFGEQGKFVPVLAVKDDQSVEVYGTLRVKGKVFATQSDADDQGGGAAPPPPTTTLTDETAGQAIAVYLRTSPTPARFRIVFRAFTETGGEQQLPALLPSVRLTADQTRDAVGEWWTTFDGADGMGQAATESRIGTFDRFLDKLTTIETDAGGTVSALKHTVEWLFGRPDAQVRDVSDGILPAAPTDFATRLAAALLGQGTQLQAVLAGIAGDPRMTDAAFATTTSRTTVADAIAAKTLFSGSKRTLANLDKGSDLYKFFFHVQTSAAAEAGTSGKYTALKDALMLLGSNLGRLATPV